MQMPKTSTREVILNFLPFLWQQKSLKLRIAVVIAFLLIPFTIALNLVLPIIFKEIIDAIRYKLNTSESILLTLILCYSILWTVANSASKLREMVFFRPVCHAITAYSMAVFNHLHNLNLNFHLGRATGKVTTAINSAQLALAMVITNVLFRILPTISEIVIALIIICYLCGSYYALILTCTLLVLIICGFKLNKIIDDMGNRWSQIDGQNTSRFVDSMLNIETVKYFNRTAYEISEATKANVTIRNMAIEYMVTTRSIQIAFTCILGIGFGLAAYHAANSVMQQQMSLGDFTLITSYVLLFFAPMYELITLTSDTVYHTGKIAIAQSLLDDKQDLEPSTNAPNLQITDGEISFEKVAFSYLENSLILQDLTFTIPSGSTFAIVGPSGCGKSTIARLLLRFFDPTTGCIKIDQQIVEECNPQSVRQALACVPQDIALFNNTLRFNICYGSFDCNDADIEEILRVTELNNFVHKLPDGLNTQVGERGLKLSGGERQRVALARALLRRTKILILDEATSSLDVNTERAINHNLAVVSKRITTLIIAHRLSTIVDADQIIVLNNGAVAERGTHHELLKVNGLYAALWNQQREQPWQDME